MRCGSVVGGAPADYGAGRQRRTRLQIKNGTETANLIALELWECGEALDEPQPALLRIQEALSKCGFCMSRSLSRTVFCMRMAFPYFIAQFLQHL
jgi:hypothetical protein